MINIKTRKLELKQGLFYHIHRINHFGVPTPIYFFGAAVIGGFKPWFARPNLTTQAF